MTAPRTGQVEVFCRALWKGDGRTVARSADKVDPNGRDRWGYTPLLMAVQFADFALVSRLVRRGADVHQGRTHLTPLALAARRGAPDIVAFLRAQGAQPSPVAWVYLGDRRALAKALAADAATARLRDEQGTPLLIHAACALAPDIVTMLLDRGVAVGEATPDGNTALHGVADLRRAPPSAAATALLLLDRGADPNARDKRGSTPLRRAVSPTGASETAGTSSLMVPLTRLLLAHGADPDVRDKRGSPVRASAREHRRSPRRS